MRIARSFVPVLVTVAASLAGCNEENPAEFAAARAEQREAIVPAGLDLLGEKAATLVTLAELDHRGSEGAAACPARSLDKNGAVVYEAEGCEGAVSGITWSGKIIAKNSPRTDVLGAAIDLSKPEELRFDQLHADRLDAPFAIEGRLTITPSVTPGRRVYHNQLRTDDGVAIRFDVETDCSVEGELLSCHTLSGSNGELIGNGTFDVAAYTAVGNNGVTGRVELLGKDVLRIETSSRDVEECQLYTIAGQAAGKVCLPELTSKDPTHVQGASWLCDVDGAPGTIQVTGSAEGAPIFVKAQLRRGGGQHELALDFVSHDPKTGQFLYRSPVTVLADVGPFTCQDLVADVGVRMVAVYANGTTDCQVNGDWDAFYGVSCF